MNALDQTEKVVDSSFMLEAIDKVNRGVFSCYNISV
jgi:hypothetical protein